MSILSDLTHIPWHLFNIRNTMKYILCIVGIRIKDYNFGRFGLGGAQNVLYFHKYLRTMSLKYKVLRTGHHQNLGIPDQL